MADTKRLLVLLTVTDEGFARKELITGVSFPVPCAPSTVMVRVPVTEFVPSETVTVRVQVFSWDGAIHSTSAPSLLTKVPQSALQVKVKDEESKSAAAAFPLTFPPGCTLDGLAERDVSTGGLRDWRTCATGFFFPPPQPEALRATSTAHSKKDKFFLPKPSCLRHTEGHDHLSIPTDDFSPSVNFDPPQVTLFYPFSVRL